MTNNLNINPTHRIKHKRGIILRMIILPQPWCTITSRTSLQRRSMELLHLLCIYFQIPSISSLYLLNHLEREMGKSIQTYSQPETQHAIPSTLS